MRVTLMILSLALAVTSVFYCVRKSAGAISGAKTASPELKESHAPRASDRTVEGTRATVDFETQVKPILEARCQGCHFKGGRMYQRLPFDRPETIRTLGEKLFTRLKDEHERRVIRDFLSQ